MAYVAAFVFLLSASTIGLLAQDPEYECASPLNMTDVPDDQFYLRLDPAMANETMTVDDESCPIDDLRIQNLSCMCGDNLLRRQRDFQQRFDDTCKFYDEPIGGHSSPLGFCERALRGMGRCVTFEPSKDAVVGVSDYTRDSLKARLNEVNGILMGFKSVLDRTLVHVYLRSEGHRCQCLEYYKRWVCATKLSFVGLPVNTSLNSSSSDTTNVTLESGPERLRPCIDVCYDVLQTCPYYLPSRYQPRSPPPPNESNDDPFFQVIYGGYPAFDCPRKDFCDIQRDNCSYVFGDDIVCFGRNGASTLSNSFTVLFVSLSLYVWHFFLTA